jgi:hypothetical protein
VVPWCAHTHTKTPFLGVVGAMRVIVLLAWASAFPLGWVGVWCDVMDLRLVLRLVSEGPILGQYTSFLY